MLWCDRRCVAAGVGTLLLVLLILQRPSTDLRLTQPPLAGDAWLLELPGSAPIVIDGGDDGTALAVLLGERLPLRQRSLSTLILTRADYGIPAQLALLNRFDVQTALLPAELTGSSAAAYQAALAAAAAEVVTAAPGMILRHGQLQLTVLHSAAGRDGGMVLLLRYGVRRIVLHSGGPAGDAALLAQATQIAPLDVLYYPWQRPADTALIAALQPRVIVYTVRYHDREPVLQSYAARAAGSRLLYHPALDGAVTLISDGTRLRLETDR